MEETGYNILKKLPAILLIIFVLFLVGFSTWQMYRGNFEAALSSLPFLLIIYLFVMRRRS
jgi:hypothetical protein